MARHYRLRGMNAEGRISTWSPPIPSYLVADTVEIMVTVTPATQVVMIKDYDRRQVPWVNPFNGLDENGLSSN